jgi:hypothetical protein
MVRVSEGENPMSSRNQDEKEQNVSRRPVANQSPSDQSDLLHELEIIGRDEKSIRPAVLKKYAALLSCEEVVRRSKEDEGRTAAEHANEALLAAVNDIVDEIDHPIAEALLCTTETFEGMSVGQRKDWLHEKHHILPHVYRDRRPGLFRWIAEYLAPPQIANPAKTTDGPEIDLATTLEELATSKVWPETAFQKLPDSAKWPYVALREMAARAANVHYLGVAALFVASQDREVFRSDEPDVFQPEQWAMINHIGELLFGATASFIGYRWLITYGPSNGRGVNRSPEVADWSTDKFLCTLSLRLDEAMTSSPLGKHWYETDVIRKAAQGFPIVLDTEDRQQMFETNWRSWYLANVLAVSPYRKSNAEPDDSNELKALAGISGAFAWLVVQDQPSHMPILRYSDYEVKFILNDLYQADGYKEIAGGLSFMERLDYFVSEVGAPLTEPYKTWDNR